MKRSPLKRKTPLKKRRSKPRRSSRVRDSAYLAFVRTLPCAVGAQGHDYDCAGPIQASHIGYRGYGQKCPDSEACAMCMRHHLYGWHDCKLPPFEGMPLSVRRAWAAQVIAQTQHLYAVRGEAL